MRRCYRGPTGISWTWPPTRGARCGRASSPLRPGLTAAGLEELLVERGREIMRQLLQDHYSLRAVRENSRPGRIPPR